MLMVLFVGSPMVLVSILVLMDAALRPTENGGPVQRHTHCFNPCFNGCRPATGIWVIGGAILHRVSILVLMDAALRPLIVDG